MTGKEDVYRGPAIRALCRITDVSENLFRFFKTQLFSSNCKKRFFFSVTLVKGCLETEAVIIIFLPPQTTMLQAIERYMKQAIVDKVPSVSSSALVSSLVWNGKNFYSSENVFILKNKKIAEYHLCFHLAHGEDELRCGETLGERGPRGCFQWQRHGPGEGKTRGFQVIWKPWWMTSDHSWF